jgi:hypothetical protein
VKFLSRGNGYKLFLTADEAVLLLKKFRANQETRNPKLRAGQPDDLTLHSTMLTQNFSPIGEKEQPDDQAVLAMRLVGANRSAVVTGLADLPGTSNYFIGNDPKNWHTNVPNYAKVRYENIYSGIDLVYYGNQSHLEYDFVVAPGADPGRIKLAFEAQCRGNPSSIDSSLTTTGISSSMWIGGRFDSASHSFTSLHRRPESKPRLKADMS